ncbi:MAG: glutamine amidotransferase [Streptosporangiaceae bacterium]
MTTPGKTVRICHLYPRLLSVAGDRGNLFAIMQRCAWRGIRFSVTDADVGDVPDFTESDLILVHGGQDREMTAAARDLAEKAGPLREAIEGNAVVLAVCAGYQLLGHYYAPSEGPRIEGIDVLDVVTEAGPTRFIGHVAVDCDFGSGNRGQLTGFENHSGRTRLGSGAEPLGRVLAGGGNNGEDGTEGARYREVYATYLHGPLLPKNPWLADHLISRALEHRYSDIGPLEPLADQAEAQAHAASLRLARRPARRWRAASVGGSRIRRRQLRAPARARAKTRPANKETRWTSH